MDIIATTLDESSKHIMGFLVVLLILITLWGLTAGIGTFFNKQGPSEGSSGTTKTGPGQASAPVAASSEQGIPDEDLVVVTATVATLLKGQKHRVVSVNPGNISWSHEGRRQHFASHKVR